MIDTIDRATLDARIRDLAASLANDLGASTHKGPAYFEAVLRYRLLDEPFAAGWRERAAFLDAAFLDHVIFDLSGQAQDSAAALPPAWATGDVADETAQ